jgi:hypothetical protein
MAVLMLAAPILPGKHEAWRRFTQQLLGSRRVEYEESRRRLGIIREWACVLQTASGELLVLCIDAHDPTAALAQLAASDAPFDCWFKRRMLEFLDLDLNQSLARLAGELIYEWACP